jgi:hypothetical protein
MSDIFNKFDMTGRGNCICGPRLLGKEFCRTLADKRVVRCWWLISIGEAAEAEAQALVAEGTSRGVQTDVTDQNRSSQWSM